MIIIESIFEILRIIINAFFAFILFLFGRNPRSRQSLYNGGFMSFFTRIRLLNRWWNKGGILVDGKRHISKATSKLGFAIIGGTGSFKSTLQYANIMASKESKLVIDVDGLGFKTTGADQIKRGVNVVVVNPQQPEISAQTNLLDEVRSKSDAKKTAHQVVSIHYSTNGNSDSVFWQHSATSLLTLLISITKKMPPQFHTFSNIRHLCQNFLDLELIMVEFTSGDSELWSSYVGIKSMDVKTFAGVQASLLTCLDRISDPAIEHLMARTTLSFKDFVEKPTTIYFIIPEAEMKYYSMYVSLYVDSLLRYIQNYKPSKDKFYQIILDEVAHLGLDLPMYCATMRKYQTAIILLLQSVSFLQHKFKENYRSILSGGIASKLLMGGADYQLAKELSDAFGKRGVHVDNEKGGYIANREVLSPREIIQLKSRQGLFIHRNESPYIIKRVYPYFSQRSLRRRSKAKPPAFEVKPLERPALYPITNTNSNEPF